MSSFSIDLPEPVRLRALADGEAGRAWMAALPALAGELARDWNLIIGATMSGGTEAYAAEVTLADGRPAVLKVTPPGKDPAARELKVLLAAQGRGYAEVYAHDEARGAVLLVEAVEVARNQRNTRPGAPPSRIDSEAFAAIEAAVTRHYGPLTTLPTMSTGATDMAFLRARGMQCYGIGPLTDSEDGPKGFGGHSDQERILESSLHTFVKFHWDIVVTVAAAR